MRRATYCKEKYPNKKGVPNKGHCKKYAKKTCKAVVNKRCAEYEKKYTKVPRLAVPIRSVKKYVPPKKEHHHTNNLWVEFITRYARVHKMMLKDALQDPRAKNEYAKLVYGKLKKKTT